MSKKILVVDDQKGIQELFLAALEGQYDVYGVSSAREMLKAIETYKPDFIFLDIVLPDADGLSALQIIKNHYASIPVVIMTAYATLESAIKALKMGASDYLQKPIDVKNLSQLVEKIFHKKQNAESREKLISELEQRMMVMGKKLEVTTQKLQDAYSELRNQYDDILHKPKTFFQRIKDFYLDHTTWFVIPGLLLGIVAAMWSIQVSQFSSLIIGTALDWLLVGAPLAIFLVLAPSVAKMMKTRHESRFGGFVVGWFSVTRVIAALWSVVFISLTLGLPWSKAGAGGIMDVVMTIPVVLKDAVIAGKWTWIAMGSAVIIGILAYFQERLYHVLEKGFGLIEKGGDFIEPYIPPLAFLIGAYIYILPQEVAKGVGSKVLDLKTIHIFGFPLDASTQLGLVKVYFIQGALIGLGCLVWQVVWIFIVKKRVPDFSIKTFFTKYWIKVYPLAWSTASEALAMPLNVSLINRHYKQVHNSVKKLVIGMGSYLNVNGTTMDVLMLLAMTASITGIDISVVDLLLAIPIVVFIGYAVPGIAGEEVFFVGPLMALLSIHPDVGAGKAFLAIYVAIQLGLPDSFRTAANVTDNGLFAILLNGRYKRKYASSPELPSENREKPYSVSGYDT